MTPAGARAYDVHGVRMLVSCDEPAVLEAVDQRLRRFARTRAEPPDVRIQFLRAGEHTHVLTPAGPSRPVYETPHGQLFYFEDRDVLYGDLAGVRLHCAPRDGIAWIEAATSFGGAELYLATHPLLTISLMELLERRGRYSLHAACLARDGHGVVLAGPTGAGKSTLALALARAGLDFLADDVVFLDDSRAGDVRVLGFADALGVTEASAALFDELARALGSPLVDGFPKRLVRIEDTLPGAPLLMSCRPHALVFPTVTPGEPSTLTALDSREAWLRLVPDVLLTEPAGTQSHLTALAALLAQVSTYELRSGADLDRAAELVMGRSWAASSRNAPVPTGASGCHATNQVPQADSRCTRRMWRASSAARARNVGCALPVAVSDALTIQPNGSMPARRECRELGARAGGFAQRAGLGAGDQYERRQRCVGQGADGGGVLLASGEATVGGYFIDESRWNRPVNAEH